MSALDRLRARVGLGERLQERTDKTAETGSVGFVSAPPGEFEVPWREAGQGFVSSVSARSCAPPESELARIWAAARRAVLSPAALADEAEVLLRGELP
jgi:hypothetical protein